LRLEALALHALHLLVGARVATSSQLVCLVGLGSLSNLISTVKTETRSMRNVWDGGWEAGLLWTAGDGWSKGSEGLLREACGGENAGRLNRLSAVYRACCYCFSRIQPAAALTIRQKHRAIRACGAERAWRQGWAGSAAHDRRLPLNICYASPVAGGSKVPAAFGAPRRPRLAPGGRTVMTSRKWR
jgi:hypothetical protein